jgi:hypothetical protein
VLALSARLRRSLGGIAVHHRFIALIAALNLAGCASKSADIAPAYVSPIQYQSYTCPQLSEEAQRVSAAAAAASGQQDSQATKDAVATTVGVIVFWPTLFLIGGDKQNAAQLAQLKGQMGAIEQASIQKNCGIQFRTAPPAGSAAPTAAAPPASSTSPTSSYASTNQK